jgi:transcriptional regulator
MYVPGHFAADDTPFCHGVIESHPFAPIATATASGELIVSHLPFLLDAERGPHGTLIAHVARGNDHAGALVGAESLVVFAGPHAYVSPTWYETHPAVPTWNYVAVHAYVSARILGEAETRVYLTRLAHRFEGPTGWRFETQPEDFQAKMVKGIVAFDLPIARLQGKAKLSQNRSATDIARVTAALEASTAPGAADVGRFMAARSRLTS